jgi:hypothetical protein
MSPDSLAQPADERGTTWCRLTRRPLSTPPCSTVIGLAYTIMAIVTLLLPETRGPDLRTEVVGA